MISSAIGFLGVNFFNLVIWANITDVIDDAEVRNGKREDGTIYAVYSFARKVGQALAGGLSGYADRVRVGGKGTDGRGVKRAVHHLHFGSGAVVFLRDLYAVGGVSAEQKEG